MAARIVYTDLDGTMVGPGGSFFRTVLGALTLEPAQALVDLHAGGVTLVLVSGRTRPQLVEACRIFGADGFVAEMGSLLGWEQGRAIEVLRGAMPSEYVGTPAEVAHRLGVVDRLLARFDGRLEYHAPWHQDHEADVMLRGRVDAAEAEEWLRDAGFGWLRLLDNGVLPRSVPMHVYHLLPDGVTKGLGVARDLTRRGLGRADAVAIGDSASDLSMAPYVHEMWLTANALDHPGMAEFAARHANVRISTEAVGVGWARAVRATTSYRPESCPAPPSSSPATAARPPSSRTSTAD